MVIYAPAKVNLYLRVLGKRPDGYHNIETVFEKIALFDKIVLRSLKSGKIKVLCDNPKIPRGPKSLIYRTASLLKEESRASEGAEIRIFKKIPVASGLGGGSSDAASVLTGLNTLWRLSLDLKRLTELGKKLGSDVPFFLNKSPFALAKGRGDEITPLPWKAKLWHLLLTSKKGLLSKDIYAAWAKPPKLNSAKGASIGKALPAAARRGSGFGSVKRIMKNDLENAVFAKEPFTARLKGFLNVMGFKHSLVSGSGPSVFTVFEMRKEAVKAKISLVRRFPVIKKKGWQIFIVQTL